VFFFTDVSHSLQASDDAPDHCQTYVHGLAGVCKSVSSLTNHSYVASTPSNDVSWLPQAWNAQYFMSRVVGNYHVCTFKAKLPADAIAAYEAHR
jgi:hypothetical protein